MGGTEHRTALSVQDGDLDLHQTGCVNHNRLELLAFPDDRHELTFVKRLHGPSVLRLRGPRTRTQRSESSWSSFSRAMPSPVSAQVPSASGTARPSSLSDCRLSGVRMSPCPRPI